jgi:ATP-dependent helicase/nuclease subunit A
MTRKAGAAKMPDGAMRLRITDDLDTTFLVEAGAGSGKTKSLVDRMISLLATGRATIQTLAAVTFTRKAAAELRGRFQLALERSLGDAPREGERTWEAGEKARLRDALRDLEQGFIGTIHSFCARLLRERPVECGVDPEFVEMEEIDDAIFREACWHDFLAEARLKSDDVLRALDDVGLFPEDLRDAYDELAMYPEVEPEPGRKEPPDFEAARTALERFLDTAAPLIPGTRPEAGWDGLQTLIRRLSGRRVRLGFTDPRLLMETLELLEGNPSVVQKRWRSKEEAVRFSGAFEVFKSGPVASALLAWREHRHDRALAFLSPALRFYERCRRARSKLNFGDQLLLTAALLRDNPEVRGYFQGRYERILVDEFQDTDPIQAEILFYLTGTDTAGTDWARLHPAPGSLFLVGDPKQSIYRFRRADIDTYNLVKKIIVAGGGEVLELVANFRSLPCIAEYVNSVFEPKKDEEGEGIFPATATEYQARFAPLIAHRDGCEGGAKGVFKIPVPKELRHSEKPIARNDAAVISNFIARAVSGGLKVSEKGPDGIEGRRPARPGDFLILFRYKKNMDVYARSLEEKGILYEISGSDAFSESAEIAEIAVLFQALKDPANAVYAVAALRGIFFGVSDQALLDHRASGGSLAFSGETVAEGAVSDPIRRALVSLRGWLALTKSYPPSVVLEKILEASGLLGYLVSTDMGSSRAGDVLKLVEIVRSLESEGTTSFAAIADFICDPARLETVEEMSLTPGRRDAVRLMNLHKAKGLEAPVVFLANPAGMRDREPDKHIVRLGGGTDSGPVEERPRGYFLFKKRAGHKVFLISQPAGWAEVVDRAAKFREAEEHRLMYVAATRAKDMLVVSTYQGDLGGKRAWRILDEQLGDVPELEPLPGGETACKPPAKLTLSPGEVAGARRRIQERRIEAARAHYRLETVTALAKTGPRPGEWEPGGLGREWGTAIHSLLNALGRAWAANLPQPGGLPVSDGELLRLAGNALASVEIGREEDKELAALVRSIVVSEFWGRAMSAGRKYFEVPFSIRVGPKDPDYADLMSRGPLVALAGKKPVAVVPGAPVFLSGAIDLVFREQDGWVIADYKTDRIPDAVLDKGAEEAKRALDARVEYYRPQVQLYSRFWEKITGEKVKESGLYFTAYDAWFKVEKA